MDACKAGDWHARAFFKLSYNPASALLLIPQAEEIDQVNVTSSFRTLLDDEEDEQEIEEAEVDVDATLLVENLGFSAETTRALLDRGIKSLFPIQSLVLQPALEGRDLIGRAKTGSGKTLAFALPVVESLLAEDKAAGGKLKVGRAPRCLILAPTRELANQVAKEFESVSPRYKVLSVYGGTSINTQVRTPGAVVAGMHLCSSDCSSILYPDSDQGYGSILHSENTIAKHQEAAEAVAACCIQKLIRIWAQNGGESCRRRSASVEQQLIQQQHRMQQLGSSSLK